MMRGSTKVPTAEAMATKNINVPTAVSGGLERQRLAKRAATRDRAANGTARAANRVVSRIGYMVGSSNVAIVNIV
ncbi:MAG TPA: hypothetical protein VIR34_06755 [Gemmatimonadaceae bacterium]|jgi:hypothetical protein